MIKLNDFHDVTLDCEGGQIMAINSKISKLIRILFKLI